MARYSTKSFFICTIFIASWVSIASALSLEELSLKVQQLEQSNKKLIMEVKQLQQSNEQLTRNNGELNLEILQLKHSDMAIKKELEMKIQHLETIFNEQQKEYQSSPHAFQAVGKGTHLIKTQAEMRNAIFRTCKELSQADPSLKSGMYWIDPDGQGVGDDPIYVECDMATGTTSVQHDSEDPTDVGHCADPGCYTRQINYSASTRQMDALSELSIECYQSIRYDCNYAPFEINNVAQAWWNDRNGVAQYFWSGSNNSVHTCQCGIDHNCVELSNLCNCDSTVPVLLNDSGVITDKKYLPITRLNFGRTQLETSSGVHTLGRFECTGQVSVSGMPSSCFDMWKIGHTLNGIYSIMGSNFVETVYCDFARFPQEQGFQTFIGYSDVKSSPVYFFVQKSTPRNVTGTIPFEITKLNIGGAMDARSGVFTAPRSGIYSFAFSGIGRHPTSADMSILRIVLVVNGNEIAKTVTDTPDDNSYYSLSLHTTLQLNAGDKVWLNIHSLGANGYLWDDSSAYPSHTHFAGHLLQENVARSLF